MKHKSRCSQELAERKEVRSFSFKHIAASLTAILVMGSALAAEPFTAAGNLTDGHHAARTHVQKHNTVTATVDPFAELKASQESEPSFSSLRQYGLSPSKSLTQASEKGSFQTAAGKVVGRSEQSFRAAGIPEDVVLQMGRAFGKDNLVKKLKQGDSFRVIYERASAKNQNSAKLLSVELSLNGQKVRRFWYSAGEGGAGFYDENGVAVQSPFIRIPVAKLTGIGSPFAPLRRHPITGELRPHYGTDFRAPRGTPVYAAGDGTVEFSGWGRGYGRMVKLRHADGYETVYGHLASIQKGIKNGAPVRRGETIGAVGSTGLSTGNHLHYEVRHFGKAYDPMTVSIAQAPRLTHRQLAQLKVNIAYLSRQLDAIEVGGPQR